MLNLINLTILIIFVKQRTYTENLIILPGHLAILLRHLTILHGQSSRRSAGFSALSSVKRYGPAQVAPWYKASEWLFPEAPAFH
jgi:hypothetical protein